ncbi:MAG: THUMP domain-containing protein [Polyangiaceae bacterium]
MEFFATAAKGTEGALRDELRELRLRKVRADRGGVHFEGELRDGMRACLHSAVAVRILWRLGEFEAPTGDALYAGARGIDWSPFVDSRRTLSVSASSKASALTHTQFVAQRTKDAIVDQIRDKTGARPSVNTESPDLHVTVHVLRDRATIYADLAGDSLHRRGYRPRIGGAPLKETLAAAIVRLAGWDGAIPFVDPMCGSGTIAIEAAMSARRIAPGILRPKFGVERWVLFGPEDVRTFALLRQEARENQLPEGPDVRGSDLDPFMIDTARANANAAGVKIQWSLADVSKFEAPPGQFVLVTNPPYGERLAGGAKLYGAMASRFRSLRDATVAIFSGTPDIESAMGRRPSRWLMMWIGPIECRLLVYERHGRPSLSGV